MPSLRAIAPTRLRVATSYKACGGPTAISQANRDLWLLSSVQVTICPGRVLPCAKTYFCRSCERYVSVIKTFLIPALKHSWNNNRQAVCAAGNSSEMSRQVVVMLVILHHPLACHNLTLARCLRYLL